MSKLVSAGAGQGGPIGVSWGSDGEVLFCRCGSEQADRSLAGLIALASGIALSATDPGHARHLLTVLRTGTTRSESREDRR